MQEVYGGDDDDPEPLHESDAAATASDLLQQELDELKAEETSRIFFGMVCMNSQASMSSSVATLEGNIDGDRVLAGVGETSRVQYTVRSTTHVFYSPQRAAPTQRRRRALPSCSRCGRTAKAW
jgi:hypothetical protein